MYKINCKMLGVGGTEDVAKLLVKRLQFLGYNVEYTTETGLINGAEPEKHKDYVTDEVFFTELKYVLNDMLKEFKWE